MFHLSAISTSADPDENPAVTVHLYSTDYFTSQTLHRAFLDFKAGPGTSVDMTNQDLRYALQIFSNGFGLNCAVCAIKKGPGGTQASLIFGRRSDRVGKNAATGTWHVTANEALTDKDVVDQRISISHFVARSLHEEVGIDASAIIRTFVFNVFLATGDFQPGMIALTTCTIEDLSHLVFRIDASQDGRLEYDSYHILPFDDHAIEQALAAGGLRDRATGRMIPFSPTADNLLRNVFARGASSFID